MIIELNRNSFKKLIGTSLLLILLCTNYSFAQYENIWLNVGSYHNWFSAIGSEIEEGSIKVQQYGARWPAIYPYQDMQAAKSIWLGCKDFTDHSGTYPYRVAHVGPRVTGSGEFFPVKIKKYYKFKPPIVSVDGNESFQYDPPSAVDNTRIISSMKWDQMIENEVNTLIGVTMKRRIFQYSHPLYDNFIVTEYVFTNTGVTDGKQPKRTTPVNDFYAFLQYRLAPCRETRYVIGNGSGWGMNSMNDVRGDGMVKPGDKGDENTFRTQFTWHGYFPDKIVTYDNIGGPIWGPDKEGFVSKTDTVGRLGAPQFIGVLTLHADKSATDHTDDPLQPLTTMQASSDDPKTSGNDAFNPAKQQSEYLDWMKAGHKFIFNGTFDDRHAYRVQPDGNFAAQVNAPTLGSPGGFSSMNGYGPYTLNIGDSVKIIIVEGANGMNRDAATEIGKQFKNAKITALVKNQEFLKGKDSLFMTWRRVKDIFQKGWTVPAAPLPPKSFKVLSQGNRIRLEWEKPEDPSLKGYFVYRASGQLDSIYRLITSPGVNEVSYNDTTPIRGLNYYYYIVSVGDDIPANPALGIPSTKNISSRYYTQTYDPAKLARPPKENINEARIVPNPFSLKADQDRLRFGKEEPNKIAFFNIPGECTIKIYTEMGELIKTIEHTNGSGDEYWNSVTDSNQIIVSGIYIVVLENKANGEKKLLKLAVVR